MAANPFVYGEVVPQSAFVGRDAELSRLNTDLADGQKVFLISPRRYGKSSLIRQTLAALERQRVATLEVTVSSFSSYVAFLEGYTQALAGLDTRAERGRSWLRDLFTGVQPEMRGDAVAFPTVRTERDAARLAEEVFALPGKIAGGSAGGWPSRSTVPGHRRLQRQRRRAGAASRGQQQRHVGYVSAGSEASRWKDDRPGRPFQSRPDAAREDPAQRLCVFVEHRFKRSGITPERTAPQSSISVICRRRSARTFRDDMVRATATAGL